MEVLTTRLIDADELLQADENSDKILVLGSGKTLEIAYALIKKENRERSHRGCCSRGPLQRLQAPRK